MSPCFPCLHKLPVSPNFNNGALWKITSSSVCASQGAVVVGSTFAPSLFSGSAANRNEWRLQTLSLEQFSLAADYERRYSIRPRLPEPLPWKRTGTAWPFKNSPAIKQTNALAVSILEEPFTGFGEEIYIFKGKKLNFAVLPATTPEERYAAASLRAQLFYQYPQFAFEDKVSTAMITKLREDHESATLQSLNNKIDSEFSRDSKMLFLGMKVTCFLAVCERSEHEALLFSLPVEEKLVLSEDVTRPPEIPRQRSEQFGSTLLAVGTLDLQVGRMLPGEYLQGTYPPGDRASVQRGYLFNLCVLPSARRKGVASGMMQAAASVAREMGLKALYVHVEASNHKAAALYESMGYTVEQEEDLAVEKRLNRCRRLLLRLMLDS